MKLSNSILPPFPLLTATIMISVVKNNQELKAIFMAGYTCYTFENTGLKYSLQCEIGGDDYKTGIVFKKYNALES